MGVSRKTAIGRRKRKRRSGRPPLLRAVTPAPTPVSRAKRALGRPARPSWQDALAPAAKLAAPAGAAKRALGSSRRPSWKLIGLAGIAGVAATGVVVARQRRARTDLSPDELRARLHSRLAAIGGDGEAAGAAGAPGATEAPGATRAPGATGATRATGAAGAPGATGGEPAHGEAPVARPTSGEPGEDETRT